VGVQLYFKFRKGKTHTKGELLFEKDCSSGGETSKKGKSFQGS